MFVEIMKFFICRCPAIGEMWCHHHVYNQAHNRAGVSYFRNQLQDLEDYMIKWEPYRDMLNKVPSKLPTRVHDESDVWLAGVPLIHFWIVEHHYPNRVMRQFGLAQVIPPALPLHEAEVRRLHNIIHTVNVTRKNWAIEHHTYVEQASHPANHLVVPTGYWTDDQLFPYRSWFQNNGMHNIFLERRCIEGLHNPIPEYRDEHGEVGYIPSTPKDTRDVSFNLIMKIIILRYFISNLVTNSFFCRHYEG